MAVYSYFGAAVIGAQWVIPDNEQAYKVNPLHHTQCQMLVQTFAFLPNPMKAVKIFCSASLQPASGRHKGEAGLVLSILSHHPVCLLLWMA